MTCVTLIKNMSSRNVRANMIVTNDLLFSCTGEEGEPGRGWTRRDKQDNTRVNIKWIWWTGGYFYCVRPSSTGKGGWVHI